jgi:hypothetical protein
LFGREHLYGPQALAGTWYNLPGPAGPDGGACDGWWSAGCICSGKWGKHCGKGCGGCGGCGLPEVGGSWMWMHSPEQAKAVTSGLYNRYCIRCHGVDGRGVWDIPGVPDFTNPRWQATRSDDQIARIIIEGRGAVMPPFRGTLTLEEAWAMAHHLRTFLPGSETSRPDVGQSGKTEKSEELPPPRVK